MGMRFTGPGMGRIYSRLCHKGHSAVCLTWGLRDFMNRALFPSRRSNPHSVRTACSLHSSVNGSMSKQDQRRKELLVTAHIIFPSIFPSIVFKIRVNPVKFLGNADNNKENYSVIGHFTCLSLLSVPLRSTTGPGAGL